ncbi:nitrogen regulation protein NR(I) [Aestuariivirga litoralis]|uniref:nitrogen regulation protein NR(I) n=1 Tax=Aestuariivirga litoralis TaxID=2650924 RepID=UPI0018C7178F|nr:nitrogen regulation protein NR(I) [Aestuariivirga litoralis]MBG1231571.1 nitrogen regulation protein NR(I) [Aestuariivirga litoralis]
MSAKTILLADDDSAIRTVLTQALTRAGYSVRSTATATALWRWVQEGQGDIIVTDVVLPDENAFEMLPRIKKLRPKIPVIVMSAQNTIMTAIRSTELGAYDYLPKPFDLNVLLQTVARALEQVNKPNLPKPIENSENLPIIGRSSAMQEIYRVIARLTQTDLTVTIIGESGTGKELVARALHDFGRRKRGPFVAVNMAAIPRELIESELFGHEKGAFTGASNRMPGRFEQAEGGTLFLDEIGDMPLEAQTRLLRVLQQGEYTSVGGNAPIKANVRIIAATHRDLRQLIGQGQFREDLFFRLNVVPLRLPSLRDRVEDIPDLARHFLNTAVKDGLPPKDISPEAVDALKSYRWPGNVRELENLMKRLMAMEIDDTIGAASVNAELAGSGPSPVNSEGSGSDTPDSVIEFMERHLARYFTAFGESMPPAGLYDRILNDVEPPLLRAVLSATKGNQLKAAEVLGINRNTLRVKIRQHQIKALRGFS